MQPAEVGERFARAVAAKDADAMLAVLAPDVDVRALTPGRPWEASSAAELVHDIVLRRWFEDTDVIEALDGLETGTVADRHRVAYRLLVRNADGLALVEQQAYYDVEGDRITLLRILCSGYRPIAEA